MSVIETPDERSIIASKAEREDIAARNADPRGIQVADIRLSHAQLLTLPTVRPIVVPAPGAGLGNLFWGAVVLSDIVGAYTNVGNPSTNQLDIWFVYDPEDEQDGASLSVSPSARANLLTQLTADAGVLLTEFRPSTFQGTGGIQFTMTRNFGITNKPIGIMAYNSLGNFTGGDAANTWSIRTYYTIVPTLPFGA